MRDNDVNPIRVIWRGNNGHAYLQFESDDGAHEAAKLLQGLSIQVMMAGLRGCVAMVRWIGLERNGEGKPAFSTRAI